jgi:hypothetical protein
MRWIGLLLPVLLLAACGPSKEELTEYEEAKAEKEVAAERLDTAEEENVELKAQIEAKERELAEAEAAREAAETGVDEEDTDGD